MSLIKSKSLEEILIHIARTTVNIGCGCCADRPSLQSDSGKETQAPAAMYTQERDLAIILATLALLWHPITD